MRAALLLDAPIVGRDRELDLGPLPPAALRGRARRGAAGDGSRRGWARPASSRRCWRRPSASGFHTLRGGAHAEEGSSPYAPFVEAIGPLFEERPDLAAGLSPGALAALALLRAGGPTVRRGGREAADRHRILSAVGQLLTHAARERPVLIALDDLHAADDATVGLVHYLARTARRTAVMLVVAAREEAISEPLARLRSSLVEQHAGRRGGARSGSTAAACAPSAERIAGRPLPDPTVRAIERSSAGNAFFVEELAAGVDAEGEVTGAAAAAPGAGGAARPARASWPASWSAPLAVLEDGFTSAELAALADREEPAVTQALEAARSAGVLERCPRRLSVPASARARGARRTSARKLS